MDLFDVELSRHDWRAMSCGCGGNAGHLPDMLRKLAHAETDEEAGVTDILDHFMGPSILMVPAPAVVILSFAALQGGLSLPTRRAFLSLIVSAAEDNGVTDDPQAWGRDLVDECRTATRQGLWYLYGQMLDQSDAMISSLAYLALKEVEDTSRATYLRGLIGDRLLPQYEG
jgi:hypothetical protein